MAGRRANCPDCRRLLLVTDSGSLQEIESSENQRASHEQAIERIELPLPVSNAEPESTTEPEPESDLDSQSEKQPDPAIDRDKPYVFAESLIEDLGDRQFPTVVLAGAGSLMEIDVASVDEDLVLYESVAYAAFWTWFLSEKYFTEKKMFRNVADYDSRWKFNNALKTHLDSMMRKKVRRPLHKELKVNGTARPIREVVDMYLKYRNERCAPGADVVSAMNIRFLDRVFSHYGEDQYSELLRRAIAKDDETKTNLLKVCMFLTNQTMECAAVNCEDILGMD